MCPKFVPLPLPLTTKLPTLSQCCQLLSFNGPTSLSMVQAPPPAITQPGQVLVKVKAASVNPLDVMMSRGYGREVLGNLRSVQGVIGGSDQTCTFPLVLGRDFSGEVVSVGRGVSSVRVGDSVWGATFPSTQGSHQEYCLADQGSLATKPDDLSHVEAASLPYAGLTAWAAITQAGCVNREMGKLSRVLVLGAGGGVGGIATQLLARYYQCEVIAVAASDAHPAVAAQGASTLLDYTHSDYQAQLASLPPLDLVLDCAGLGRAALPLSRLLRPGGRVVSLTSPVLANTDQSGLLAGTVSSISSLANMNCSTLPKGNLFSWAFFIPSSSALDVFHNLVKEDLLVPSVSSVYKFSNIEESYREVEEGHSRGKVVLEMTD